MHSPGGQLFVIPRHEARQCKSRKGSSSLLLHGLQATPTSPCCRRCGDPPRLFKAPELTLYQQPSHCAGQLQAPEIRSPLKM